MILYFLVVGLLGLIGLVLIAAAAVGSVAFIVYLCAYMRELYLDARHKRR